MNRKPEILTLLGGILICCDEHTDDDFVLVDPNIIKEGVVSLNIFKDNNFMGTVLYGPEQREKTSVEGFMGQIYRECFMTQK